MPKETTHKKTKPKKIVTPAKKTSSSSKPAPLNKGDVRLEYSVKVVTADGEKISLTGEVIAPFALSKTGLQNAQTHFDQLFTILVEQPLKAQFQSLIGEEMEKAYPQEAEEESPLKQLMQSTPPRIVDVPETTSEGGADQAESVNPVD